MRTQRTAFAPVYASIPRSFARWNRRCKVETALKLAPAVGFEPTTNRLTADRSTTELRWIDFCRIQGIQFVHRMNSGKSFPNRDVIWLRGLDLNQRSRSRGIISPTAAA